MKRLKRILPKKSGRNAIGRISVRHQGGRAKRFLREIDFKRLKRNIFAQVSEIQYDPNRNSEIAFITYEDGTKNYILAPLGLKVGARVVASESAEIKVGNSLPLSKIPIGTQVHNIEIKPGRGGQVVKSAGSFATVQGKEAQYVLIKLPSAEIKRFPAESWASIGQVGNILARTINYKKAGRKRHMGIRPTVRGVVMHPHAHPHGGGEGRSSVGLKYPKTVYGRKAVGKTRKKGKYSDPLIVSEKKRGPHH